MDWAHGFPNQQAWRMVVKVWKPFKQGFAARSRAIERPESQWS